MDIARYADHNAPYIVADNIDDLIKSSEEASSASFQWFDICHWLISEENGNFENLIGVKLDRKLNFDDHFSNICKRVGRKLNACARIALEYRIVELSRRHILISVFFNS